MVQDGLICRGGTNWFFFYATLYGSSLVSIIGSQPASLMSRLPPLDVDFLLPNWQDMFGAVGRALLLLSSASALNFLVVCGEKRKEKHVSSKSCNESRMEQLNNWIPALSHQSSDGFGGWRQQFGY